MARLGVAWVDIKHSVGRGEAGRLAEQVGRYCEEWGPGALVYTLGYTEAFADQLRAAGPVWVLDPAAAEALLDGADGASVLESAARGTSESE